MRASCHGSPRGFRRRVAGIAVFLVLAAAATPLRTQLAANETSSQGTLVVAGGGALPPAVVDRFVELGGGATGRLVVIPTASAAADDDDGSFAAPWAERFAEVSVLHARSREQADDPAFHAALAAATAVWIGGGDQSRLADAYTGTATAAALQAVLQRGGVVGGTSAGAAIQTATMIAGGRETPRLAAGLDLLPGAVVDQHFAQRDRIGRLLAALRVHPHLVGLGIDEGTALEVRGRRARVLGSGHVTVALVPGAGRTVRLETHGDGAVLDLEILRRAAAQRASGRLWPHPDPGPCRVRGAGTLVIVGGGRLPAAILTRFADAARAAAGPDRAPRVVVVTAASGRRAGDRPSGFARLLAAQGLEQVTVLDGLTPADFRERDALRALVEADAVWFGGGRQWRIVDAFDGTPAGALVRAVVARGGVVGGSSAGATIQGEFLVRGHPLGNQVMMAEGYEEGLGLLVGAAIDQHFTQRGRRPDLEAVVQRHPGLVGLGIDEGTAAVVVGDRLEVVGAGTVTVLDRRGEAPRDRVLEAGATTTLGR